MSPADVANTLAVFVGAVGVYAGWVAISLIIHICRRKMRSLENRLPGTHHTGVYR